MRLRPILAVSQVNIVFGHPDQSIADGLIALILCLLPKLVGMSN
jgi:hypothetical protein